jgi:hypothetical protein
MIGSRFLNFEDEIYLRGVECNIPPVSIGILPVDRARGLKFKENKRNGNIYYGISAHYEISISVASNVFKARAYW